MRAAYELLQLEETREAARLKLQREFNRELAVMIALAMHGKEIPAFDGGEAG